VVKRVPRRLPLGRDGEDGQGDEGDPTRDVRGPGGGVLLSVALHGFPIDEAVLERLADLRPKRLALFPTPSPPVDRSRALRAFGGIEALYLAGWAWANLLHPGPAEDEARLATALSSVRELHLPGLSPRSEALTVFSNLQCLSVSHVRGWFRDERLAHLPIRALQVGHATNGVFDDVPDWTDLRSLVIGAPYPNANKSRPGPPSDPMDGLPALARFPGLARLVLDAPVPEGSYRVVAQAAPALVHLSLRADVTPADALAVAGLPRLRALAMLPREELNHGTRPPQRLSGIARVLEAAPRLAALGRDIWDLCSDLGEPLARLAPRAVFVSGRHATGTTGRMTPARVAPLAASRAPHLAFEHGWGLSLSAAGLRAAFPGTHLVTLSRAVHLRGRAALPLRDPEVSLVAGLARGGAARAMHPRFADWAPLDGEAPGRAIERASIDGLAP